MKILCVFGQHNYGDPNRGEGYEYQNFIPALRSLGHEVVFFDSWNRRLYNNFAELNKDLLDVAAREKPDFVLCVQLLYEVWIETIYLLRSWGACVVNWATDDDWKYDQFSKLLAPHYDAFVTTYPKVYRQYRQDGIDNVIVSQWAASSACIQEPIPAQDCRYSVSFVGAKYGNRAKWIRSLAERGVQVNCFGYGWDNGPVTAEEIPRIIRDSLISLNFSDSSLHFNGFIPHRSKQIKARVFEVPGAGGMLLTERSPGLENYFTAGKDMDVYSDINELAGKIYYYCENYQMRDKIAGAGNIRTRVEHTYEERMKRLITEALDIKNRRKQIPCDIKAWEGYFAQLADAHKIGRGAAVGRWALTGMASLFFGKRKGARFIRRLLFELGWRMCGDQIYMAKGLPGRLFYYES
jgi:Uncharacterized protein conserved in bacteria